MARSLFTLCLLLHYLLVVGAGMVEQRPTRVADRPFPYVHHHECQERNYLRVGCFDDCNGVQYAVKKTGERPPLTQLLSSLKGLDLHCLPAVPVVLTAPSYASVAPTHLGQKAEMLREYHSRIELPPRQG